MNEQQVAQANHYTDPDIARLLGISLGRLRNKLTAGSPLPPHIQSGSLGDGYRRINGESPLREMRIHRRNETPGSDISEGRRRWGVGSANTCQCCC